MWFSKMQKTSICNIDMKQGFLRDISFLWPTDRTISMGKKRKAGLHIPLAARNSLNAGIVFCRELNHLKHKEILSVWCSSFRSSLFTLSPICTGNTQRSSRPPFSAIFLFFIILCSSSSDPVRYHEIHVIWIGGNKYFVDLFFQKY